MDLYTYISDMGRRAQLAKATKKNPDYLWQVATGRRKASPELAMAIEANSSPVVRKGTIRPDLWAPSPKSRAA